ncbi:MAG: hypothetical protein MI919_27530 [Holophagales bacterium]|nr:hypothetical protein [Holophagales bacterium]
MQTTSHPRSIVSPSPLLPPAIGRPAPAAFFGGLVLLALVATPVVSASSLGEVELERRLASVELTAVPGPDGGTAYRLPRPERLAHFRVGEGREVSFYHSPITEDVIYDEVAGADEALLFDEPTPILERYLALAGDEAPVPAVLVAREDGLTREQKARLTAGRRLVDVPLGSVEVDPGVIEEVRASGRAGAKATASCTSATTFANNHCYYLNNSLIAPNRRDPIWCCDENYPGACGYNPSQGNTWWYDLTRSISSFRKNSFSTTAACSTNVLVVHYWKFGGVWYTLGTYDQLVLDDQVRSFFVMGGGWYPRRITYSRTSSSGGLRAYSEFSNP